VLEAVILGDQRRPLKKANPTSSTQIAVNDQEVIFKIRDESFFFRNIMKHHEYQLTSELDRSPEM
jgi:hypothetical protein